MKLTVHGVRLWARSLSYLTSRVYTSAVVVEYPRTVPLACLLSTHACTAALLAPDSSPTASFCASIEFSHVSAAAGHKAEDRG